MKRWLLIVWLLPVAVWGQKLGNDDFLNLFRAIDASELHVYTDELDGYFSDVESQWKVGEGVSLFAGRRIRLSQCEQLRGWVDAVENDDLPTYAIGQFALGKSYRGLLIRTYGEYWASSIRLLVWDNFGERVTQMIELADQKVDEGEESFKEGWLIKEKGKQYVVIAGTAYGIDMQRYEAEMRSQTLEGEVPKVVSFVEDLAASYVWDYTEFVKTTERPQGVYVVDRVAGDIPLWGKRFGTYERMWKVDDTCHCTLFYNDWDQEAMYPGGEDSLRAFLLRELPWNELLNMGNISGRVYVRFTIESNGRPSGACTLSTPLGEIETELRKVLGRMPYWRPAYRIKPPQGQGKLPEFLYKDNIEKIAVRSQYNMAIPIVIW